MTDHVAAALHNAREHERVYFLRIQNFFGKISEWFYGRKLLKTLAVLGAITILVLGMIFIPWDYRVEGEGRFNAGRATPSVRPGGR